jgi:hypothetical protein
MGEYTILPHPRAFTMSKMPPFNFIPKAIRERMKL